MPTIKHTDLEAVALSASTEQTRYYLCGVCFEPYADNTVGLIATDGHRLSSINARRDISPPSDSFIMENADIAKAVSLAKAELKANKSADVKIMLNVENNVLTCSIISGDKMTASFTTKPVDGNFPDWRRVFPSGEPTGPAIVFNGAYMADFAKAAKILGDRGQSIQLTIYGAASPIGVELHYEGFAGVLMPLRF